MSLSTEIVKVHRLRIWKKKWWWCTAREVFTLFFFSLFPSSHLFLQQQHRSSSERYLIIRSSRRRKKKLLKATFKKKPLSSNFLDCMRVVHFTYRGHFNSVWTPLFFLLLPLSPHSSSSSWSCYLIVSPSLFFSLFGLWYARWLTPHSSSSSLFLTLTSWPQPYLWRHLEENETSLCEKKIAFFFCR